MSGVFITLEGGEGTGKSTQLALLAHRLEVAGHDVLALREPGGSRIGERIRAVLLDPSHHEMDAVTELFLYEAARAQMVAEIVRPALDAGRVVVCDRFFDSTTAYQGYARGLDLDRVRALNAVAAGECVPHRTIVLDLDCEKGIGRATACATDRLEAEDLAFHRAVREGFLAIARDEPERVRVVDASGSLDEVSEAIAVQLDGLGLLGGDARR